MTSAIATDVHIHILSPAHGAETINGVELGTCDCGTKVCRQVPAPGRCSVAVPRDWDLAHAEALAEHVRLRGIDMIRALADFLESHPEMPAVRSVSAHVGTDSDEHTQRLATSFGTTVYGELPQFDVDAAIHFDEYQVANVIVVHRPNAERAL